MGRLEGKVVLVPFVIPGERVRVETEKETGGLIRARLVEVIEPSPERVNPRCPLFGKCGGCHYQHTTYKPQLKWKKAILAEVLRRVGKIVPPEIAVVDGAPWEYRNRVQFHILDGRIGFHGAASHRLWPVEQCPLLSPPLNEALRALRRMIPQPRFPGFLRSVELFTNGERVQLNVRATAGRRVAKMFFEWCAGQIPGANDPALDCEVAGDHFRVSHGSFFQVNRFLAEALVETAVGDAAGDTALDLYAGAGLFTLRLARRIRSVTAVESARSSSEDLAFNAGRAGVTVRSVRASVGPFLEGVEKTPDYVIADPPRSGLGKKVVGQLLRLRARRLTIVSCDASTLARDLAALLAGGYELGQLTLVDLFPQTSHIEAVAKLRLR